MNGIPFLIKKNPPVFDKIIPKLYLGNVIAASNPEMMKDMNLIVNLSSYRYDKIYEKDYIDIDIPDIPSSDIKQYFWKVTKVMNEYIQNGKNVFIHCAAGISRSVSIIVAYLMTYQNMSLLDSLYLIKSSRKQETCPNPGFFIQLQQLELYLFGKNSMTISDYITFCVSS